MVGATRNLVALAFVLTLIAAACVELDEEPAPTEPVPVMVEADNLSELVVVCFVNSQLRVVESQESCSPGTPSIAVGASGEILKRILELEYQEDPGAERLRLLSEHYQDMIEAEGEVIRSVLEAKEEILKLVQQMMENRLATESVVMSRTMSREAVMTAGIMGLLFQDTDLNGASDLFEDSDGDGILNIYEDADGNGTLDILEDSDQDGVPNPLEDDDGDTVTNVVDRCPGQPGAPSNHGCPPSTSSATSTTSPPPGPTLDPSVPAAYGEYKLISDFLTDPAPYSVVAGGPIDLTSALPGLGCSGWAAQTPSFQLDWVGTDLLRFYFVPDDKQIDTVLVIRDPSGSWSCADDSYDAVHPTVDIDPSQNGFYDIWVATHGEGGLAPGTLYVTELVDNHP